MSTETVPKGYKRTEVGVIPEEWEDDFIEAHCHITTGGRNTQDRVDDGQYPFFVRSQTIERINSYSFDGEAILTAGDGVGTGKVFHYIDGKFDAHQRVYRISDFDSLLSGKYFFLYFSNHFYSRIMQMTAKSSVDSVRREMIAKMRIPLPPKAEQQAIAAALSDADALIESLEQLIAKKRQIKQGAMQELLTGKRRLPGFTGKWCEAILSDFLVSAPDYGINAPGVPDTGAYPRYLRITDITDDGRFAPPVQAAVNHPESSRYILSKDEIVFARTGASVGKSYLYKEADGELVFAGFLIRAKIDPSKLSPEYLAAYTHTAEYWNWVRLMSMRSGQPGINGQEYASMSFCIPPTLPEQTAIAAVLSDMDTELEVLEGKLDKARQIKQGMMQQLLTGKVRLV